MNQKEAKPYPTGRFPSAEEEHRQRFDFISPNNPLLKTIREKVNAAEIKRWGRNLPRNLLALYYGVYFYNHLTGYTLFDQDDQPPIKIENEPYEHRSVFVQDNLIYINLHTCLEEEEFTRSPLTEIEICEEPSVSAPAYIIQILTGLEEANHLHLGQLHRGHLPDFWNHSDHRFPKKLWQNSGNNPLGYRAKLWHEFAALTVQWVYLNHYVKNEFPETVDEFNYFYSRAKKMRTKWVKRKVKGLTTRTNFV